MNYFYIHTISYYEGNQRDENIESAFNKLNTSILSKKQKEMDKNLLIVYIIYDELTEALKEKYEKYKNLETEKTKILILYRWNTGGTVQTLYYTYKYIINNNISCNFIGVWEDDAIFKNDYFLDVVNEYLKKDYIFVGSLWPGSHPLTSYNNGVKKCIREGVSRALNRGCWLRKKHIYIDEKLNDDPISDLLYCHCEDPYVTTIENLKKIESILQKFTLCPENIKYTHIESGINYGEVGFPTRLTLHGFKFYGLPLNEHFIFLNQNTVGKKNE